MDKDKKNKKFEKDLLMLQYFQEEFQYRHKHFWNILILLFVLCVVIIILPIAPEVMGIKIQELSNIQKLLFPVLGMVVAGLSFVILKDEAKKIGAVNEAKYRINSKMAEEYRYVNYVGDMADKKKKLSLSLPVYVLIAELLLCLLVLFVVWKS